MGMICLKLWRMFKFGWCNFYFFIVQLWIWYTGFCRIIYFWSGQIGDLCSFALSILFGILGFSWNILGKWQEYLLSVPLVLFQPSAFSSIVPGISFSTRTFILNCYWNLGQSFSHRWISFSNQNFTLVQLFVDTNWTRSAPYSYITIFYQIWIENFLSFKDWHFSYIWSPLFLSFVHVTRSWKSRVVLWTLW